MQFNGKFWDSEEEVVVKGSEVAATASLDREKTLVQTKDGDSVVLDIPIHELMNDLKEVKMEQVTNETVTTQEVGVERFLTLEEVKKRYVTEILEIAKGNKTKTAAILGVTVKTVYNMIAQYELK